MKGANFTLFFKAFEGSADADPVCDFKKGANINRSGSITQTV
jgi:hypothetical protein